MIAKEFIIAKLFLAYGVNFFRDKKSLRDHTPTRRTGWALWGAGAARWGWDETVNDANDIALPATPPVWPVWVAYVTSCHRRHSSDLHAGRPAASLAAHGTPAHRSRGRADDSQPGE